MTMKFIMTIDPTTTFRWEVVGKLKPLYGMMFHFSVALREERTHIHCLKKSDTRTVVKRSPVCSIIRCIQSVDKLYGVAVYNSPLTIPLIETKSYYNKDREVSSWALGL